MIIADVPSDVADETVRQTAGDYASQRQQMGRDLSGKPSIAWSDLCDALL